MRASLLVGSLLLCSISQQALAQVPVAQPLAVVQHATIYFDANGAVLPSEVGSHHQEEITFRDSVSGTVRTFFPSGKIQRVVPYAHLRQRIAHGHATEWFENGKLKLSEEIVAGKKQGERATYYPSGTIRRREQYANDQRTAGECFGPDGQPVAFFEYETVPVYPEGAGDYAAVAKAVQRNVKLTKETKREARLIGPALQMEVLVSFVVDKTGHLQNIRLDAEISDDNPPAILALARKLQGVALQAVQQLQPFATPGQQDGEAIEVTYVVPVAFRFE